MADYSKLLIRLAGVKMKELDLNAASTKLLLAGLKIDAISEQTLAAGVTIDGLLIKDSKYLYTK